MSRIVALGLVVSALAAACGGGSGDDEDQITRIDGPAVVDDDGAGAQDPTER